MRDTLPLRTRVLSALLALSSALALTGAGCTEDDRSSTDTEDATKPKPTGDTPADDPSKGDTDTALPTPGDTDTALPTPGDTYSALPTPGGSAELSPSVPGIHDDAIVFGQSAALTGPSQALGKGMRLGILTAFHEVNSSGGVHGRNLELVSLDDTYEPVAALDNTVRLIEDEKVFALIGATGTPTSEVAAPAASIRGVPYIAPFTGAGLLRSSDMGKVVNFRASYAQETEEMVRYLKQEKGFDRIAVMFQDDAFGREGYRGVVEALKTHNEKAPTSIGYYTRNTTIVKSALIDLQSGNPQAVIVIGTYTPTSLLIRWARKIGFNPVFMVVSFVGADTLAEELKSDGEGVLITQVVPFPLDEDTPAAVSYRNALQAYNTANDTDAQPDFVSFEGYLAGRLAIQGLRLGGANVTRQRFMDELFTANVIDIDGLQLRFNKSGKDQPLDNQGSDYVFLTIIDAQGELQPAKTSIEAPQ